MRSQTNFHDFRFKGTVTAAIRIPPTKAWSLQLVNFKNAIRTWGQFRRTICNKILFLNLDKNATEMYGMPQTAFGVSCMNWALVFEWHKSFKEDRESVRDDERFGRCKEVNTPELIGQRDRVRVTILGFKGVQEEISLEEASTLQIGLVVFPPEQCTSLQLHPCHRLFDQNGLQDSSSASV